MNAKPFGQDRQNGHNMQIRKASTMTDNRKPILFLVGPTAIGKTAFAIELAEHLGTEIIGADSMQIYQYMDIGTGKPTKQERDRVCHHLVDFIHPSEPFSVGRYRREACDVIDRMHAAGQVSLVVGGTGLYIRSLTNGLFDGPEADPKIRSYFKELAATKGRNALYDELKSVDPKSARKIHPNDERRLIRALEVYRITGRPISELQEEQKAHLESQYRFILFGLTMSRNKLYTVIEKRIDKMIRQGLVDEVRSLLAMGVDEQAISMQGLGYKEIIPVILRKEPLRDAVELLKKETRHFAKRQFTWFKAEPGLHWLDIGAFPSGAEAVHSLINLVDQALLNKTET